jgi:hypothetical protein
MLFSSAIRIADPWDKAVVLRLGQCQATEKFGEDALTYAIIFKQLLLAIYP